jgi:hypothetical protein
VAAVPQIEGLTVESMLELAKTSVAALRHLPDERDWDGLNRKWVADILYTIERAKFEKMIKEHTDKFNKKMRDHSEHFKQKFAELLEQQKNAQFPTK